MWPLTYDFEANPFRYQMEPARASPLLWHSILALSYKHIHRETGAYLSQAKVHKRRAMQLLEELESRNGSVQSRTNLLNGLLILITLDVGLLKPFKHDSFQLIGFPSAPPRLRALGQHILDVPRRSSKLLGYSEFTKRQGCRHKSTCLSGMAFPPVLVFD